MVAARILHDALADGGWHESRAVKEQAESEGVSERTLQRAFRELRGEDKREGFPAVTYWRLPSRAKGSPMDVGATVESPANPHGAKESATPSPPVAPVTPTGIEAGATDANGRRKLTASEATVLRDKVARAKLERQDAERREQDAAAFADDQLDLGTAPLGELREKFGA
jgi:hypothetical protein